MTDSTFIEVNGHSIEVHAFRKALTTWGKDNFRPFPWRFTDNPYQLLMAEVMLHRTQAIQVVPVYELFIKTYPDIQSAHKADPVQMHSILYPLGLRWRADLIITMIDYLITRYNGHIPQDKTVLLSLPGVSDYVASAVRCFAFNQPDALIDTNTVRITGRLFNLEVKDSSRRSLLFRKLVSSFVDPEQPRSYNYALLDHGAQICTKGRPPACTICPVQSYCLYGASLS